MKRLALLMAALLMLVQVACAAADGRCENPPSLRFSMVPESDPERQLDAYRPLLLRLEQRLHRPVELRRPSSYGSVIEGLLEGSLDVAVLGPASYARARQQHAQVDVFATVSRPPGRYHQGGTHYNSVLIVRADSPYRSLQDLEGHPLSLTDPVSTSGSVLPHHTIQQITGQSLESYFGRVGYAGTHPRAIRAVLRGEVDAAFVASMHLERSLANGLIGPDDIRILWRSDPIPEDALVARTPLCADIQSAIRDTFLHSSKEERRELMDYLQVSDIVPALDDDYRQFHELAHRP